MTFPKVSETTTDQSLLGRMDAFHVPAVLVRSVEYLSAGDCVSFVGAGHNTVRGSNGTRHDAVVDPFLTGTVECGTLFWVFLVPESVGNLTHHFEIKERTTDTASVVGECSRYDDDDDDGCPDCYGDYK